MLDKISLKIMNELCHDGRSSNIKLARKLGVNVATVAKKLNAMIEEGVIAIKAMPNPAKMGYQTQAFIGLYVDLKKIDSVCAQLMDDIHINMLVTCFGRFNILLIAFFREWGMLQSFTKEVLPRIEGINNVATYLISEDKKRNGGVFPSNFIESKPVLIDELDQKIMEELIRNGRYKYTDLANKLGISLPTVSRRITFLLKENIIKILAIPNHSKLGYSANAFTGVRAELANVDKICDQLFSYPDVHLVMRLMNDFDILFGVHSSNADTLYEFMKSKVASIDGILSTETFILGNFQYFSAHAVLPPSVSYPSEVKTSSH